MRIMKGLKKTPKVWAEHIPQRTCVACRGVKAKRELIRLVRSAVNVPLIASGGAGSAAHCPPAVAAGADAVLAASIFHFGQVSIGEVKSVLAEAGYPIRRAVDRDSLPILLAP